MRLYKVIVLVNLALGIGLGFGYLWWGREVGRLTRELMAAKQKTIIRQAGEQQWSAKGIVRQVMPDIDVIFITHEEIPGLMGSMTMGFRTNDPKLLQSLSPGDLIQFTLKDTGNQLLLVAVRKEEGSP